jgi:hydroxymethylglutaryl-CoA reductase
MTTSQFVLPIASLEWKGVAGHIVAARIIEAFRFAEDDPFRAATNNKGNIALYDWLIDALQNKIML